MDLTNNKRPTHSDILAFDIQRGRDHGLQPYFKYLEHCNNIKVNDWKDIQKYIMPEVSTNKFILIKKFCSEIICKTYFVPTFWNTKIFDIIISTITCPRLIYFYVK